MQSEVIFERNARAFIPWPTFHKSPLVWQRERAHLWDSASAVIELLTIVIGERLLVSPALLSAVVFVGGGSVDDSCGEDAASL